jgi:hypothetical protein
MTLENMMIIALVVCIAGMIFILSTWISYAIFGWMA